MRDFFYHRLHTCPNEFIQAGIKRVSRIRLRISEAHLATFLSQITQIKGISQIRLRISEAHLASASANRNLIVTDYIPNIGGILAARS